MHSQLEMGWKREGRGRMADNQSFRFSEKKKEGTMGHFDFLSANADSGADIFKQTDNYTTRLLVLNAWKWRLHNLSGPKINSLFRMHKAIEEKEVKTKRRIGPFEFSNITSNIFHPNFQHLHFLTCPQSHCQDDHGFMIITKSQSRERAYSCSTACPRRKTPDWAQILSTVRCELTFSTFPKCYRFFY